MLNIDRRDGGIMSLDKITGSFCQVPDISKHISEKSKKPYRVLVKWIKMEPNVQFVVSSKGTVSLLDQTDVWILLIMFLAGCCRPSGHSCKRAHTQTNTFYLFISHFTTWQWAQQTKSSARNKFRNTVASNNEWWGERGARRNSGEIKPPFSGGIYQSGTYTHTRST